MNYKNILQQSSIGSLIKSIRKFNEISVIDLKDQIGIASTISIYKWEKNEVKPSAKTLLKILDLVQLTTKQKEEIWQKFNYVTTDKYFIYRSHARSFINEIADKDDVELLLSLFSRDELVLKMKSKSSIKNLKRTDLSKERSNNLGFKLKARQYFSHLKLFLKSSNDKKDLVDFYNRLKKKQKELER